VAWYASRLSSSRGRPHQFSHKKQRIHQNGAESDEIRYATPRYRPRRPKSAPRPIADPASRPLLPLLKKESPTTPHRLESKQLQPLHRSIATQTFNSQDQYQSFVHFLKNTSNMLPGLFRTDLWKNLLPQASYDTPFIRSALIAIGALSGCGRKFQEDKFATR